MSRFSFALLLLLAPSSVNWAEAANVTGAKIVDFGIYSYEAKVPAPGPGNALKVRSERLIKTTKAINAKIGLTFGFRFMLYGTPSGAEVTLQFKGTPPNIFNADTRSETNHTKWEFTTAIDQIAFVGFTFDHEWEIIPGKWIFVVSSKGRPVATKTFTVVK